MRHPILALVFALALAARPSTSAAQCIVTPGEDGEVSTWLTQAGPRAALSARTPPLAALRQLLDATHLMGTALTDLAPTSGWRPASAASASLDLRATAGLRGAGVAYAAVSLRAASAGRRWLSLGSDDALAVYLDGREVFRRCSARSARADDDYLPLDLTAGTHSLVLKLASRGDQDLIARLVGADHRPDASVMIELPGVNDAACTALARESLSLDVVRRVAETGLRVTLSLRWRGGVAHPAAQHELPVEVSGGASMRSAVPLGAASVTGLDLVVPAQDGPSALVVRVGEASRTIQVAVRPLAARALRRATSEITALDGAFGASPQPFPRPAPRLPAGIPLASLWSVERAAERLATLTAEGDRDASHIDAEASSLLSSLDDLRAGRDPYLLRRGAIRRAYRSPLDGTLQEYSVFIPPSYRADAPFPVVVGLHGLHGTSHRMLPILLGLYDESENRVHADRHLPEMPDTSAILVAPWGFGDAGYRQQGEHDVVRVVQEVHAAYRTDPLRTYITGLSMGGIGAAGVPFHHPDLFAASAALCGYHSYFVRGDTRGPRRPWETYLMELRSNDRIAENGLHLPMYIVQGTLDRPLAHSQVLADRYRALGYSLEAEWPTLGHNVWSTTYADGRIVPWFLRHRRDPAPASVRLRSYELRWNRSAWVTLDALAARDARGTTVPVRAGIAGEVQVTAQRGALQGTTQNVLALTLSPPRSLLARGADHATITLDGDTLRLRPGQDNHLVRRDGRWTNADARPTLPAGGPIRELFDSPMVFVVGTADPAMTRVNERVARHWAHRPGVPLAYPVVTDEALTESMAEGRTLVFVGTPSTNRALARIADRLPVRFDGDDVLVGGTRHRGAELGAVFSTHHPEHPDRAVLVIGARSARALLRSLSLPDLLPAYVVFDESVAEARGRVLLGDRASVLAAGFFDATGGPLPGGADPRRAGTTAE